MTHIQKSGLNFNWTTCRCVIIVVNMTRGLRVWIESYSGSKSIHRHFATKTTNGVRTPRTTQVVEDKDGNIQMKACQKLGDNH